jgi:hypothetical protein
VSLALITSSLETRIEEEESQPSKQEQQKNTSRSSHKS